MNIRKWFRDLFTRITSRPEPVQVKIDPLAYLPPAPHTSVVLAKKTNQRHKKLKKCPVMQKNMYTRDIAKSECDRLSTRLKHLRIYLCEHCSTWHLTHKKTHHG